MTTSNTVDIHKKSFRNSYDTNSKLVPSAVRSMFTLCLDTRLRGMYTQTLNVLQNAPPFRICGVNVTVIFAHDPKVLKIVKNLDVNVFTKNTRSMLVDGTYVLYYVHYTKNNFKSYND